MDRPRSAEERSGERQRRTNSSCAFSAGWLSHLEMADTSTPTCCHAELSDWLFSLDISLLLLPFCICISFGFLAFSVNKRKPWIVVGVARCCLCCCCRSCCCCRRSCCLPPAACCLVLLLLLLLRAAVATAAPATDQSHPGACATYTCIPWPSCPTRLLTLPQNRVPF